MPTVRVLVRDINTKRPIAGAFVDLDGYTAVTDSDGTAVLTVPPRTYTVRVTRRGYTPGSLGPFSITFDGTLTIDLVPAVSLL